MRYVWMSAGVFWTDFFVKRHMDKKYALHKVHTRCGNKIWIEKYYNKGAALNFMEKQPRVMRALHTVFLLLTAGAAAALWRAPGHGVSKTGMALLLGGGCSNLYDRYTKGHVVDYFRINIGPKRFRQIVFNISDFCVFLGTFLAIAGYEE